MNWLIAHLVADYLLQPDWMGNKKKENILIAAAHCMVYSAVMWAFTGWPVFALGVVFISHIALDGTTWLLRILPKIGYRRFMEPPLFPWSYIIVDNTIHLVVLFGLSLVYGNGMLLGRFGP